MKKGPKRININYKENVWRELDKILAIGIIVPVEESKWISSIAVQDKKNRGSHICVDLHNLNDGSGHDLLPTPFTDKILKNIRGREVYSFIEQFLGYHQVKIV